MIFGNSGVMKCELQGRQIIVKNKKIECFRVGSAARTGASLWESIKKVIFFRITKRMVVEGTDTFVQNHSL